MAASILAICIGNCMGTIMSDYLEEVYAFMFGENTQFFANRII